MNPAFAYPKARHRRGKTPGPFGNYRRYKPYLRAEFSRRCIYCQFPDTMAGPTGSHTYHVDHYRPMKRFPELRLEYWNLFYACHRCNKLKGAFWPTAEERGSGVFVPNPCDYVMFDHLRFQGARILPRTKAGRWTEELLELNDPDKADFRLFIIKQVRDTRLELLRQQRRITKASEALASGSTEQRRTAVSAVLAELLQQRAVLDRNLSRLLGLSSEGQDHGARHVV